MPSLPRPFIRLLTPLLLGVVPSAWAADLDNGQSLFAQHCASCHLLAGDAIGPPLGGITSLLSESELIAQITQPEQVLASGDPRANALFRRYKVAMPPFAALGETKIRSIIAFLAAETKRQNLVPLAVDLDAANQPLQRLISPPSPNQPSSSNSKTSCRFRPSPDTHPTRASPLSAPAPPTTVLSS